MREIWLPACCRSKPQHAFGLMLCGQYLLGLSDPAADAVGNNRVAVLSTSPQPSCRLRLLRQLAMIAWVVVRERPEIVCTTGAAEPVLDLDLVLGALQARRDAAGHSAVTRTRSRCGWARSPRRRRRRPRRPGRGALRRRRPPRSCRTRSRRRPGRGGLRAAT